MRFVCKYLSTNLLLCFALQNNVKKYVTISGFEGACQFISWCGHFFYFVAFTLTSSPLLFRF